MKGRRKNRWSRRRVGWGEGAVAAAGFLSTVAVAGEDKSGAQKAGDGEKKDNIDILLDQAEERAIILQRVLEVIPDGVKPAWFKELEIPEIKGGNSSPASGGTMKNGHEGGTEDQGETKPKED